MKCEMLKVSFSVSPNAISSMNGRGPKLVDCALACRARAYGWSAAGIQKTDVYHTASMLCSSLWSFRSPLRSAVVSYVIKNSIRASKNSSSTNSLCRVVQHYPCAINRRTNLKFCSCLRGEI